MWRLTLEIRLWYIKNSELKNFKDLQKIFSWQNLGNIFIRFWTNHNCTLCSINKNISNEAFYANLIFLLFFMMKFTGMFLSWMFFTIIEVLYNNIPSVWKLPKKSEINLWNLFLLTFIISQNLIQCLQLAIF